MGGIKQYQCRLRIEEELPLADNSIFSQPIQPAGMFTPEAVEATTEARTEAQPKSSNPFATGTNAADAPAGEAAPRSEADEDARVLVQIDAKRMQASVLVDSPAGAGRPVDEAMLSEAIKAAGVVYGLNTEALARVLAPTYNTPVIIAEGTPPENGRDGACTELFEREPTAKPVEFEDGSIDHRQLGLVRDVSPGTVICEMVQPTEGTPGTTVLGEEVKAIPGKKVAAPVGEGTRLSEDGTQVLATLQGNLCWRNSHFVVDTVYRVDDVDYDVGNIVFSGDVQVNGQMHDGFEIHAGGTVTVQGSVGNVVIEAAGDIKIDKGINGTGQARIETRKTLTTGFIENCNVKAGEKIVASSLINSNVECEGDVEITQGKGIICGGKLMVSGSVTAKEVGNESNTLTAITLGVTPSLLAERKKTVDRLGEVSKHIDEMVKNSNYIEKLMSVGKPVPEERVQMLRASRIQLPLSEKKRDQLQGKLDDIDTQLSEASTSTLSAKTIFPPTRVTIGKYSASVAEVETNCRVYRDGNQVIIGR